MTPEELAAIRERDRRWGGIQNLGWPNNLDDRRRLLAEVDRLAAELTAERARVERALADCASAEKAQARPATAMIFTSRIRAALDDDPRTETVTLELHSPVATDNTNDAGTLYVCEQSGCGWGWRTHDEQDATSKWSDAHTDGAA